jgi:hypothetical protein
MQVDRAGGERHPDAFFAEAPEDAGSQLVAHAKLAGELDHLIVESQT